MLVHCTQWHPDHYHSLNDYSSWFALANLLLTKEGTWRKSVTIKLGFPPKSAEKTQFLSLLQALEHEENFKTSLIRLLACPPHGYSDAQWETLTALTEVLPLLAAQLFMVFQEKGQIDFNELNLAAVKALGTDENPTDLTLYLDYQIRHLLIDEFQDTSVLHMQIIEKMIMGWEANDGRTLFLVGDPMQSIYRFRNAEVGLFLRVQKNGIGHIPIESLALTMNFRSQKGMVDWFNLAFESMFPEVEDIATGRVTYTPAIAALPLDNKQCVYTHYFADTQEKNYLEKIIQTIQALKKNNPTHSIALLARSRNQLKKIIYALHENQLSFQAVDIELLISRIEIQDVLSLTQALLHEGNTIAWLSLLRAPFCGLSLQDLLTISQFDQQRTLWENINNEQLYLLLTLDGQKRITRVITCLTSAFKQQQLQSLSQWIKGIWIELGGLTSTDAEGLKEINTYFDLMDSLSENSSPLHLNTLKDMLQKLYAKPNTNKDTHIHVMTIHKSKGLEFDHVIIPSLDSPSPAEQEKLFRWLERPNALGTNDLILGPIKSYENEQDPIYHYLKKAEQEKLDHELTRLFYVGATRAKKSLHLLMKIQKENKQPIARLPSKRSFLYKLWPLLQKEADDFITRLTVQNEHKKEETQHARLLFKRLPADWHSPYAEVDNSDFINQKKIYIPLSMTTSEQTYIGTMMHLILQRIALGVYSLDQQWPKQQWQSELLNMGLCRDHLEMAIQKLLLAMNNIQNDSRARWILSNTHHDVKSEWALSVKTAEGIQSVIIDRTFVDAEGTRWIIDYKTSDLLEDQTLQEFLLLQKELYQHQLSGYANAMRMIDDRPIQLALYFPLNKAWIAWDYTEAEAVVALP